jgi:hypothetical protein
VEQLADELKTLRSTIEQTMPMLSAFNEAYSNSASGDRSIGGKLSGLLSGALNRNQNTNNASDQGSGKYGNLVNALEGVLSENNNSKSTPLSANTIRELESLQAQLQPVSSTLQNLKVDVGSSNATNSTPVLTPTGKSAGNRPKTTD